MSAVSPIASARLDLIALDADAVTALLEGRHEDAEVHIGATIPVGWPDDHDARFLRFRLDQLRDNPDLGPWFVRAVVLRSGREMVGHAGFHGPPGVNGPGAADAVEVGYTVFPRHRGEGYATEAASALIAFAAEKGVARVIASVAPDNAPSLAVVHKLGFEQTGDQWDDEDGRELVFERPASGR
ncbi:MAG TPA: GNAT family N-acetyltransferase [Gaiellaceae bacterium]|jgi:RimJ/RimL family protein N-acetyltransferase